MGCFDSDPKRITYEELGFGAVGSIYIGPPEDEETIVEAKRGPEDIREDIKKWLHQQKIYSDQLGKEMKTVNLVIEMPEDASEEGLKMSTYTEVDEGSGRMSALLMTSVLLMSVTALFGPGLQADYLAQPFSAEKSGLQQKTIEPQIKKTTPVDLSIEDQYSVLAQAFQELADALEKEAAMMNEVKGYGDLDHVSLLLTSAKTILDNTPMPGKKSPTAADKKLGVLTRALSSHAKLLGLQPLDTAVAMPTSETTKPNRKLTAGSKANEKPHPHKLHKHKPQNGRENLTMALHALRHSFFQLRKVFFKRVQTIKNKL